MKEYLKYAAAFAKGFIPYYGEYSCFDDRIPKRTRLLSASMFGTLRMLLIAAFHEEFLMSYAPYSTMIGLFSTSNESDRILEAKLKTSVSKSSLKSTQ